MQSKSGSFLVVLGRNTPRKNDRCAVSSGRLSGLAPWFSHPSRSAESYHRVSEFFLNVCRTALKGRVRNRVGPGFPTEIRAASQSLVMLQQCLEKFFSAESVKSSCHSSEKFKEVTGFLLLGENNPCSNPYVHRFSRIEIGIATNHALPRLHRS